jgi:hypothetical protein
MPMVCLSSPGRPHSLPDRYSRVEPTSASPAGRPQGSHPHIRPTPALTMTTIWLRRGLRGRSKGRGGSSAVWGPLRLPWGGMGPLARLPPKVSGREGRPQGSPPRFHTCPRPYYDHGYSHSWFLDHRSPWGAHTDRFFGAVRFSRGGGGGGCGVGVLAPPSPKSGHLTRTDPAPPGHEPFPQKPTRVRHWAGGRYLCLPSRGYSL